MNRFYLAAAIVVVVIAPIASLGFEAGALGSTIAGFLLSLRSQTIESLHWLGSHLDDWVATVLARHARRTTISALSRLDDSELKDIVFYRDGIADDRRICEWKRQSGFGASASNREAQVMMRSKMIALRVLASIVVVVTTGLILSVAGLPMDWLSCLMDMSLG
jgi:uncharacterized protein YjiS (DUF1127 family)